MGVQYTAIDFLNKLSSNNFSYSKSYKKKIREENTDVEIFQDNIKKLKKNVKSLGKYSKDTTPKSRLEVQLKSLVKTYNSMSKDAGKVSDDEYAKQINKLNDLFSENEKILKKIGLKKSKEKLTFDSEVFDKVDDKTINKLFEGKNSFIKKADKLLCKLEKYLEDSQYSINVRRLSSVTQYNIMDMQLAQSFVLAKETTCILSICSELIEAGVSADEYEEELILDLGIFAEYVYNNGNNNENVNYKNLQILCDNNKEELSKIGLTFSETSDGKKQIDYDNVAKLKDEEYKNAFINLFGKDSEFISNIIKYCNSGFEDIIKPDRLGIYIVDEYA